MRVRSAPSGECPANRKSGQRCWRPARHGGQRPHGIAGSTATRSPARGPDSIVAREFMPEDERPGRARRRRSHPRPASGGRSRRARPRVTRSSSSPGPGSGAGSSWRRRSPRAVEPERVHRVLAVVRAGTVLAEEVALEQVVVDLLARRAGARECRSAIAATASSAIAFSTACATSAPQVNGPCEATSTAGISSGSSPQALERLDDHVARLLLVVALDLVARQRARDGDRPAEVVGVRRAEARELAARLRPRGRERRVRVDDAADAGEAAVEDEVRGRVRRRPVLALDDARRSRGRRRPSPRGRARRTGPRSA